MYRYYLEVSYDGTAFAGSQVQLHQKTVQGAVNDALSTILRTTVETFGASRTDMGVHALSNVYHFDIPVLLDEQQLVYKLNAITSPALGFNALYRVPETANARFDALSRSYRYRIYFHKDPFKYERALFYPFKLNRDVLHDTAAVLADYTDFTSFSKKNSQTFTNNCKIIRSSWETIGDELHYVVEANRFLRGMVRALVGTQLKIARAGGTSDDFRAIVAARDCSKADFSVTGNGLYLEKITYPPYTL